MPLKLLLYCLCQSPFMTQYNSQITFIQQLLEILTMQTKTNDDSESSHGNSMEYEKALIQLAAGIGFFRAPRYHCFRLINSIKTISRLLFVDRPPTSSINIIIIIIVIVLILSLFSSSSWAYHGMVLISSNGLRFDDDHQAQHRHSGTIYYQLSVVVVVLELQTGQTNARGPRLFSNIGALLAKTISKIMIIIIHPSIFLSFFLLLFWLQLLLSLSLQL